MINKMNALTTPPEGFFNEEIRSDYVVTSEMKKVWSIEIELAEKLIQICDKHGLKCWADGGTLIGAIRHGGFIPWDDDIDMVMMRDDYDQLVQVINDELEEPYFFECIKTDRHHKYKTAKLMKSGTTAILDPKSKGKQCIFIDVFVYDGMPHRLKRLNQHLMRIKFKREVFNLVSKFSCLLSDKMYKRFPLNLKLNQWFEKTLRKYPVKDAYLVARPTLSSKVPLRRKGAYDETAYVDFEYIKLPIPTCYDELLTSQFGDYMTPMKLAPTHGGLYLDPNRNYDVVRKELLKKRKEH